MYASMYWLGNLVALVLESIHVDNSQATCLGSHSDLLGKQSMHTNLSVSSIIASQARYPQYWSQVTSFCYTDEHLLNPVEVTWVHSWAPVPCDHQCDIVMPSSCAPGGVMNICSKFVLKPFHKTNTVHAFYSVGWWEELLSCTWMHRHLFCRHALKSTVCTWRMGEAWDSLLSSGGFLPWSPGKPWVRQAKAKEKKRFIWHIGWLKSFAKHQDPLSWGLLLAPLQLF